jgi:signal transduction histidine kinase
MLDYSQIKSGVFRKNFANHNIRDTIKKVMHMQAQKAKHKKIKFEVEFVKISEDN